ncbi:glycosyltransferase [Neptuniibacter marinus]|uniref:glycosyltransferase n=1 Tax=Neptuniibacter marinus TaxID=1806670 RepID=UPI00082BBF29|nr:glycosyltransferase [Neptuniibacter marinus]
MRIYHGPVNIAGIGAVLADYQRKKGYESCFDVWVGNSFFKNHDVEIFNGTENRWLKQLVRLKYFYNSLFRFDIYSFYFGQTLLPYSLDLPLLKLLGKKIVMTYCGSDIRLSEVEKERNPYWEIIVENFSGGLNDPKKDNTKKIKMLWQGIWVDKFIAPRNLYHSASLYIPRYKIIKDVWVHNLSFSEFLNDYSAAPLVKKNALNESIVIVHAPTSPAIKGTKYFNTVISNLIRDGYDIEYIELTNMDHKDVVHELYKADIVLDQILLGGFGSLSVEAMAFGKPVICYLIESVKEKHYPECPIVNANISNIEDKIKELVSNKEYRDLLSQKGVGFVRDNFDYIKINEQVIDIYNELIDD